MVTVSSCDECHTPKVFVPMGPMLDSTKLPAGYPAGGQRPEIPKGIVGPNAWGAFASNEVTVWAGPSGVSFAYNLTPDMKTGIGGWTEDMFIQTLRKGKFMGSSRDILPPMPWQNR